jgi:hypothetical protein
VSTPGIEPEPSGSWRTKPRGAQPLPIRRRKQTHSQIDSQVKYYEQVTLSNENTGLLGSRAVLICNTRLGPVTVTKLFSCFSVRILNA